MMRAPDTKEPLAAADDKPPLIARDASDRGWMERWLNAELDKTLAIANRKIASDAALYIGGPKERIEEYRAWLKSDGPVMLAAKHGDLGPARDKYPELFEAGMLRLPPRSGRGKRFPKDKVLTPDEVDLTNAVWDAAEMRAIWKQRYPRRPTGYNSPEAMAARRYGIDEERVHAWAKNRRCLKRSASKTQ
jgi:hypothetical protein